MAIKQCIKNNGTSLSVDHIFFIKSTMELVTMSRLVDGHIKDILYISIYIVYRNLKRSNNVGSKININISKAHKLK